MINGISYGSLVWKNGTTAVASFIAKEEINTPHFVSSTALEKSQLEKNINTSYHSCLEKIVLKAIFQLSRVSTKCYSCFKAWIVSDSLEQTAARWQTTSWIAVYIRNVSNSLSCFKLENYDPATSSSWNPKQCNLLQYPHSQGYRATEFEVTDSMQQLMQKTLWLLP